MGSNELRYEAKNSVYEIRRGSSQYEEKLATGNVYESPTGEGARYADTKKVIILFHQEFVHQRIMPTAEEY